MSKDINRDQKRTKSRISNQLKKMRKQMGIVRRTSAVIIDMLPEKDIHHNEKHMSRVGIQPSVFPMQRDSGTYKNMCNLENSSPFSFNYRMAGGNGDESW